MIYKITYDKAKKKSHFAQKLFSLTITHLIKKR